MTATLIIIKVDRHQEPDMFGKEYNELLLCERPLGSHTSAVSAPFRIILMQTFTVL
jgi:hypothetical protein